MKFMFMGLDPKAQWERLSHAEHDQRAQRRQAAGQALITERGLVRGEDLAITSVWLGPSADAITLRPSGGKLITTDGPFVETEEVLTGFDVVDFASLEDAVSFAKTLDVGGGHVTEIRPVQGGWWVYHGPGAGSTQLFIFMFASDEQQTQKQPAAETDRIVAHHESVGMERNVQKGVVRGEPLCFSGARLHPSTAAITLRPRGTEYVRSDGPFAETKEVLGGFNIMDCRSQAEAVEWAHKLWAGAHQVIEIRSVVSMWSIVHN